MINIILIIILIYSGYNIAIKILDYKKATTAYDEIRDVKQSPTNDNSNFHKNLADINKDYVFWLSVDNTNIDYPVVKGNDNSYYLYKDFNKNDSSSGSIFMDFRNNFYDDKNIIVYGHNMKNKTMFNMLEKFKDETFWQNNNKIKISHGSEELIYEVFSAYVIEPGEDYLIVDFESDSDYNEYLNNIKSKSIYESNIILSNSDRIITLSTCSYEFNDARTVVHGRLVR